MKLIILSIFSMSLIAADNELFIYGKSIHYNVNKEVNEFNPGIGYGYYYNTDKFESIDILFQGSIYYNSAATWSKVVSIGTSFNFGNRDNWHTVVNLNYGYMYCDDYKNFIIIPAIATVYDKYSFNVAILPRAFGMFLGYKF